MGSENYGEGGIQFFYKSFIQNYTLTILHYNPYTIKTILLRALNNFRGIFFSCPTYANTNFKFEYIKLSI